MTNHSELSTQILTPRYAPRLKPTTIPIARWNEEPLLCLKVNDEWVSHLLGVLVALDQGDTWLGTQAEIDDARQQVNEIMLAFMEDCNPMDNCCPEPNRTRYTSDGKYEVSYDGGMTWVDGSDFDPRYTSPQFPPIPGANGDAKKCSAANSVLVQIKDKVETWEGMLATAGSLAEFGLSAVTALVAGILGGPGVAAFVFGVCITIIKTCWDAGEEAYSAAFTESVFDDLLCIVYCHVASDGTFSDEAIAAILADCGTHFDSIPRDAFRSAFTGWGVIGTTNAAALGGGGEDCDDCDCGDGCDNDWIVYPNTPNYFGVMVEQTSTYMIVRTDVVNTNGIYYTYLRTNPDEACCVINHVTYVLHTTDEAEMTYENFIENGEQITNFGADCGSPIPTEALGPKTTDNCMNQVQFQSGTPYAIMYLKDACP